MKRFTLETKWGCQWLLALFVVIVLVSSMLARVVSTDGFKLKVEQV